MPTINDSVQYLKGVGPAFAKKFEKLGIVTIRDLLLCYPRKYIDYTVNTDERICDGFYYATTLKHLKRLLSHPEQLDKPAPVVNHDIE